MRLIGSEDLQISFIKIDRYLRLMGIAFAIFMPLFFVGQNVIQAAEDINGISADLKTIDTTDATIDATAEDSADETDMQVIMVLDTSGSMKYTDPENMTAQAASLFLDMMKQKGSKAGIISFSDQIRVIAQPQNIEDISTREMLKEEIAGLTREGDTDIGAAAEAAVDLMIDNHTSENKDHFGNGMIVLFTDGCIDLPHAKKQKEAEEQSLKRVMDAADKAAKEQIPFFVVGLDEASENEKYRLDRDLCEKIAKESGGREYYAKTADDLPVIFNQMFADYIEVEQIQIGDLTLTGDGDSHLQFTIPNSSVLEANVILLTQAPLSFVDLDGPGVSYHMAGGYPENKVFISESERYTLIKLLEPESGEWTINIAGDPGCSVHVSLLFNYDIELKADVQEDNEGNAKVTAWFERQGQRLADDELCSGFNCIFTVFENDEETDRIAVQARNGVYQSVIPVWPGKTIGIKVHAAGREMSKDTEMLTFTSARSDDIIVRRLPGDVSVSAFLRRDAVFTVDLQELFEAWDGSLLTWECSGSDERILQISCEQGKLFLQGKANGSAMIHIRAKDAYGKEAEADFTAEIDILSIRLIPAAAGLVSLIMAGTAVFAVLMLKQKRLHGYLSLTVTQSYAPASDDHAGTYEISLDSCRGKKSIPDLFPDLCEQYGMLSFEKVLIKPWRKGIRIFTNQKAVKLTDCYGKEVSMLKLIDGDTFEIEIAEADRITILGNYESFPEEHDIEA